MGRLRAFLLVAAMGTVCLGQAQTESGYGAMTWEDFVERMADDNDEDSGVDTELMERLEDMHERPVDINSATKAELQILPFLSDKQIEAILKYVGRYGKMASLGELMMVEGLSESEREMLRLFVCVGADSSAEKLRQRGLKLENEAVWRTSIPLYTKAGFYDYPDEVLEASPNKAYCGDKLQHSLRYSMRAGKSLAAGMQMEKDGGERGIDYLSGYVMAKDLGVLSRAIVGNYRIGFGHGLAVNNSAMFGKMMLLNKVGRMDEGIVKHSSMSENGYFTGGAATVCVGDVLVSAFASYHKADGTMRQDSLGISSLKTDGLHRTPLERSKDGNIGITDFGGNIHWEKDVAALSATVVATHFDTPLAPTYTTESTLYKRYNAQGQSFLVGSLAYRLDGKRLMFTGETAVSNAAGWTNAQGERSGRQSGWATLNSLRWEMDGSNALTLIGRFYGPKFVSINGKAFGESSEPRNERGVFVGWSSKLLTNMKLDTYVDLMYFPWLKYQVSDKSYGGEAMAQIEYRPRRNVAVMMRYRLKTKEKDYKLDVGGEKRTTLRCKTNHNAKMQLKWDVSPTTTLNALATATLSHFGDKDEMGYAISGGVRWQSTRNKARVNVGMTYFNTDSYDSRVYVYEASLPNSFGFASFSDEGLRANVVVSLPIIGRRLFAMARVGSTYYFGKRTIGTGLDLIDAKHREDVQVQLRWIF